LRQRQIDLLDRRLIVRDHQDHTIQHSGKQSGVRSDQDGGAVPDDDIGCLSQLADNLRDARKVPEPNRVDLGRAGCQRSQAGVCRVRSIG
jgi:hypothetical protein